jgi:RNA polymerase sigma-B factor
MDPIVRPLPGCDAARLPRHERLALTQELLSALADADGGDRESIEDRLVRINLGVAHEVARRYRGRGIPVEDLEQVACLGLVKAVKHYDAEKATDFLSYAVPTIRGEVRRWFRDAGWIVRPPRSLQELQAAVCSAQEELQQSLGRLPQVSEVARHLGEEVGRVVDANTARGCFAPTSLDAPVAGAPEGSALGDRLAQQEPGYARIEAKVALEPALRKLPERDRCILSMRFVDGATQREIGEQIGVTQMQVSRLLARILARLREEISELAGPHRTPAT